MPEQDVTAFVTALRKLEADEDVDALVDLYAEQSVSMNLAGAHLDGREGARQFWSADRSLFDSVQSEFRHIVSDGDVAMLEWERTGQGRGGDEVKLNGVSVVEFAGGQIVRFSGYIDPAALGHQSL